MRNGNPAKVDLSRAFASKGDSTPRGALFAPLIMRYSSVPTWAIAARRHGASRGLNA